MYERFTDRAREVLRLANQIAHGFNIEYVTTEHILLAILQEGSGVAANALRNLAVAMEKVSEKIEQIVPRGPYKVSQDMLPQSPCVKQVITDAIQEAEFLEHRYVGTEHLLLGIVRQKESVAAQVLMGLGLTLEAVRGEVLRLLGREIPVEKSCNISPYPKAAYPCAEHERIRSLEQQLWNVRLVLGAVVGALAGALLFAQIGAVVGLLLGGLVAALGWRTLGVLAGGGVGALLGCTQLPNEGGGLASGLLGAVVGFLIAEIGRQRR